MQDKILKIVQSVLGETASMETNMTNTPIWDSLKTLQIVMELDEAGMSLPFEQIAEIHSVRDIVDRLSGGSA